MVLRRKKSNAWLWAVVNWIRTRFGPRDIFEMVPDLVLPDSTGETSFADGAGSSYPSQVRLDFMQRWQAGCSSSHLIRRALQEDMFK